MRLRSLSLEQKLPLLMTGVLVIVVGASLVLTYRTLTASARAAAETHLSQAAQQLAASIETGVNQRAALQRRVASDSAIQRALRSVRTAGRAQPMNPVSSVGPDETAALAAARTALERLTTGNDSTVRVQLWSEDGRALVRLGRESAAGTFPAEVPEVPPWPSVDSSAVVRQDSVRVGEFYSSGGRVYFGISVPVADGSRLLGHIGEQHLVVATPNTERGLRALIGEEVTARYRNRDGALWSTVAGVPVDAVERREEDDRTANGSVFAGYRREVGDVVVTEASIGGTPWVIALELPTRAILAAPRSTMVRLGLLSLLLVTASAVVSWLISKRITKPLATLAAASAALARGDVSLPVDDAGGDEVAHLAKAFTAMRAEIATAHSELEAQVEEAQCVTEELEQANEQLIESKEAAELGNRAKSDFLAVMSHELRTPLNAIGGYVQLLDIGVHGPVNEQQREALSRIARSQHRLLTLINDVLNFAKLDAGRLDFHRTPFPINEALGALEPLIAPQVRAKGLTYAQVPCGPAITVFADYDRFHQVMLNLLSNAIKFTPAGGSISVECDAADDAVLVRVRDTGVGISPERARTIFEPFVQAKRTLNQPHDGVGLGLSIARDLARGMDGELTVESEPKAGSVFTLRLPRAREIADQAVSPRDPAAARVAVPQSD
ncbi:MAG: ATP-binding region ATPase domain protein [Geminicoccaceae bacterium]|nr:ATP-binding region ATPase domain protein [Geminicoccaceae bacterium]